MTETDRSAADGRWISRLCLAGAVAALLVDAIYLVLVGPSLPQLDSFRGPFIAAYLAVLALAAAGPLLVNATWGRSLTLGFATAGLWATGVIAIFSIGLPLIVASLPVGIATFLNLMTKPRMRILELSMVGAAGSIALLVVGLYLTELPISCGSMTWGQGGGSSWWHGNFSYSCDGGKFLLNSP